MSTYYDFVLGIIPLTLVGVVGAGSVVGVAMSTAVTVGSLIAAGFVVHALFINPPKGPDRGERSTSPSRRRTAGRMDPSAEVAD